MVALHPLRSWDIAIGDYHSLYGGPPDLVAAQLDEACQQTSGVLRANFATFVDG